MKKVEAIKLVNEKVDDLKSVIASLKTNDSISKNTRGTQLYARSRERRILNLISALMEQCKDEISLKEADMDTFTLITALSSERKQSSFEAKVGDSVLELMKKYPNKPLNKIEAALDKINLAVDPATMKVIKA